MAVTTILQFHKFNHFCNGSASGILLLILNSYHFFNQEVLSMKGTLYGVGVGPGDPELMTVKAIRMIRENSIIAVPGAEVKETVAL